MNKLEFSEEMNRLTNQFGKQAYGSDRVMLIWQEVSALHLNDLREIINEFLGSMRQAPLLPEFREAASKKRERNWRDQKAQQSGVTEFNSRACIQCGGLGVVLARLRTDMSAFAFRCNCSIGNNDPRKYPRWERSLEQHYVISGGAA